MAKWIWHKVRTQRPEIDLLDKDIPGWCEADLSNGDFVITWWERIDEPPQA